MIVERAPAKVNLALHVTGRRSDGYHLLDSLVAFADFGDQVQLQPGPLSLQIDGPFADGLEIDGNLCLRAAQMAGGKVAIRLTKNLPVASGIGGGSADAAAVLRGLAQLGVALPANPQALGADVPVCLLSSPARMQGIGDIVTRLPDLPRMAMVLVNPLQGIATPQVFTALERRDNPPLPDIPHFATPSDLISWLSHTRNDLQNPACNLCPAICDVLQALEATGAAYARMSGSGATCFGLFLHRDQADQAAKTLIQHGWWAQAGGLAPSGFTGYSD